MMGVLQDVRYALRQLRKSPGFAAVAVLSLALGIGAGTAVFSLVNAILLRSLPVPNPQELRVLGWTGTDARIQSLWESPMPLHTGNREIAHAVSHPMFLQLREQGRALADIFGFFPLQDITARTRGNAFSANGMMVSGNFFSGLGVKPFIGRLFDPGDEASATDDVVVTYDWWEKHWERDHNVLGQSVFLNGTSFTIIGVLPRGFSGIGVLPRGFTGGLPGDLTEFYVSMSAHPHFLDPSFQQFDSTHFWFVRMMARVKPGSSDAQLKAALDSAFAGAIAGGTAGARMNDPRILVEAGRGGLAYDHNRYRKPLLLMLAVVGLVVLVACANLAGLSLARGLSRQHELAARSALGASRWRLIRQSLAESLSIASLGGGFGVLLALWGRTAISRLLAGSAEGLRYDISLNFTVLGFSLASALVTAILSGLMPAWRAGRVDPLSGIKSQTVLGAPRLWTGKALVAAQVCISLLLLSAAGLYARTVVNLTHIDTGFNTEKLLLFQVNPGSVGYTGERLEAFYEKVAGSLAAIPGVRSATILQFPLLGDKRSSGSGGVTFPNSPVATPQQMPNSRLMVGDNFFATMGIPILRGRGFNATDTPVSPKSLVINETFARQYLKDVNPIGLTVNYNNANWIIVGICRDAKYDKIKESTPPTLYVLFRQSFYDGKFRLPPSASFAVRTELAPIGFATDVRKAVNAIDPNVPLANIATQEEIRDQSISQERLLAMLCGALAGLALLLCCIGLYGLMAYQVARRIPEFAIRMALGADRRNIADPILREALLLAAAGLVVGVPTALGLTRFVKSQLYGVAPTDAGTLIGAGVLLIAVAILAAWIPARRAAKVDPVVALRYE